MPWNDKFSHPIELPDGSQLATLLDAAELIQGLAPAQISRPTALEYSVELLIAAAESGQASDRDEAQAQVGRFLATCSLPGRAKERAGRRVARRR